MWVPWLKSPARIHTRTPSSATHHHLPPPQTPPHLSPIHHKHSVSFKDVETLLHHHPPSSPFHPARSPARTYQHHHSLSLKDVHSLFTPGPTRKTSIFHRVKSWAHRQAQAQTQQAQPPPDSQNRVVIYYTSLRIVRKTFTECRTVRSILKGYRVKVDERDVSMDASFLSELQSISKTNTSIALPRVYVNGRDVGGAEEVRRMHESGELKRLIQGLPMGESGVVCGVCGGFRFVVCEECDGSHRVFVDEKVGFGCCGVCNENGLVRCPSCTSVHF